MRLAYSVNLTAAAFEGGRLETRLLGQPHGGDLEGGCLRLA